MYEITEWLERYEVNDKGQPARVGDKLRVSAPKYIRSKIHGRSQGAGFARLQEVAGGRAYEVFGIFQKFLEIAGCEDGGENRGKLLNEKGIPASNEDLAFILRTTIKKTEFALQVLCDNRVGWIIDNGVPEIPGIPGKSGVFLNITKPNITKPNITQHNTSTSKAKKTAFDYTDEFLSFWSAYPKKTGKGDAFKSWKKIQPDAVLQAKMIAAIAEQEKSEQWQKEGGQFVPNPATWLNQGRWDDEIRDIKHTETAYDQVEELKRRGEL